MNKYNYEIRQKLTHAVKPSGAGKIIRKCHNTSRGEDEEEEKMLNIKLCLTLTGTDDSVISVTANLVWGSALQASGTVWLGEEGL